MIHKVVSGAQTGVDRDALDAAMESGVEAGGWCPEGRLAEDGVIPERYQVEELPHAGYWQRTLKNVIDSDGTAVIYFGYPTGGTEQTIAFCITEKKPFVLIDAEELKPDRAAEKILAFTDKRGISVLNVAGPRASDHPEAYDYARQVILTALRSSE